jgi:hypothetical protein
MTIIYFKNVTSIDELKHQYRNLAKQYHSDHTGGSDETMKLINLEYEYLYKTNNFNNSNDVNSDFEIDKIFLDKIKNIISLDGLIIELCGSWIWITGNTYSFKEILKENGFFFASVKKAWFWRPDYAKVNNYKELDLNEIKSKYGSKNLNNCKINFCLA